MVIRDLNEQVEKALQEIQMKYSKGQLFTIFDLFATQSCINANNFSSYKARLESSLSMRRVAQHHSTKDGVNTFRRI